MKKIREEIAAKEVGFLVLVIALGGSSSSIYVHAGALTWCSHVVP